MVSRNISTVITVGGSVAASLPSSMKRAVAELDRLKLAQQQDVAESNRLRTALRGLSRNSDEYRLRTQQLKDVQERINLRVDRIGEAGVAARTASRGVGGLTNRLSALRAGLGPAGLALGAVTGIMIGLGAAFSRAGAEANDILITSSRFGVSAESFQRGAAYMRTFTQDAGRARRQFETLLGVGQAFERVRYGEQLDPRRFLAAARLGINVNDLIQGQLDPTQLFERVVAGFQDLAPEEALLRAEVLLGPELAANARAVHEGNLSLDEANRRSESARILSTNQLRANQAMGQNIDEIRQLISELVRATVTKLVPYGLRLIEAIETRVAPVFDFIREQLGIDSADDVGRDRERALTRQITALETAGPNVNIGDPSVRQLYEERDQLRRTLNVGATGAPIEREPVIHPLVDRIIGLDVPDSPTGELGTVARALTALSGLIAQVDRTTGDFLRETPGANVGRAGFSGLQQADRATGDFLRGLVGRQYGGVVRSGETTLVGERGPEIARFPVGTEIIRQYSAGNVGGQLPKTERGTGEMVQRLIEVPTANVGGAMVGDQQGMDRATSNTLKRLVGRQDGGMVRPGEITLVGEDGPEIARFPSGTEIIGNDRIQNPSVVTPQGRMGHTTVTQTFYVSIHNPSSDIDIERSLADAAAQVAAGTTYA